MKQGQILKSSTNETVKTRGLQKGQILQTTSPQKNVSKLINSTFDNPNKVLKQAVEGNPVPHVNPTVKTQNSTFEKTILSSAKKALAEGKDLTGEQLSVVKKYGLSYALPDSATAEYDIFADNNPLNKARLERVKTIAAKQKTGESITEDENNTLETFKLINEYKKSGGKATGTLEAKLYSKDSALMTGNTTENAYKTQDVKAKKLYNEATYDSDKLEIGNKEFEVKEGDTTAKALRWVQNKGKTASLYINAGLEQYAQGLNTTADVLIGKSPEKIADSPDGAYSTANAMLKQYYTEHGEKLNSIIQDTVTNIANNAPGMVVGAVTGLGWLGQVTFGISVFGNAYKEGAKLGIYDPTRLLIYSIATTASEVGLEALIGGLPGMGGVLSGEVISGLSGNVSSAVAKAVIKIAGNALGEFIEEGTQSLLSPILQKYILGADVETVVDDPLGALSDAAYEGFIGALTSVLTGGIGSYSEAVYERNVQASGKYYNAVFKENRTDVKNVAKFFEETSEKKTDLNTLSAKVAKGDTSDLAVGNMMRAVAQTTQESNKALFAKIGENVRNSEGGLAAVVSSYEEAVNENKNIFPDKVEKLYNEVKQSGDGVTAETLGEFALAVETYAPRAAIMGDIVGKTFGSETETELAQSEIATDTNDGDSVLHNPEIREIAEDVDLFDTYIDDDGQSKTKTSRHKHIENTVAKTGAKLIWSTNVKSGKYIPSSRTIIMNPELNTSEAYNLILKHEFTHYLESKKGYTEFKNYVFEKSGMFEEWAREKLENEGISADGSRKQIIKQITELYYNEYKSSSELSEFMRKKFTMSNAEEEVLADFVGENLLGTRENLEKTLQMLTDLKHDKPSIFEKIRNFIREMIERIKGVRGFKTLEADLEYLNGRLQDLVAAPDIKNTAAEGDVKYSIAGEKARTADKTLLETAKERIENGEDSETVRQEIGWFKGYDGKWRFEISDREAELNDKPDFEVRGNNSLGFYRVARLDKVLKHDDLLKAYPQLKDYTVIVQETNPGTTGAFFEGDNQIVLSDTLFRKESEKYKNSVNKKYEEIRKIEQSPEFKEYNKFYDDPELAEIDAEQWLVLEKEAEKKFYSSEIGKRYYKLKWGKSEVPRYELGWTDEAKSVLMHEIQHAVQEIEDFARGSSTEYWGDKLLKDAYKKKNTSKKKLFESRSDSDLAEIVYLYEEYVDRIARNGNPTKSELAKAYDKFEKEIIGEEAQERFFDFSEAVENYYQLKSEISTKSSSMYRRTAGEIEARDVSNRLDMTAEERRNTRPDIDRTDVVFADGSIYYASEYAEKFSEQIDDWLQGKMPKDNYFDLGITSPALVQSGAQKLPLVMPENVIYKFTTDYNDHSISLDDIKRLPYELQDPVFTFKGSIDNSIVALTEITDKSGNEVIAAIHLSKKQGRYIVNRIASVYGKNNIKNYVLSQIENGNLIKPSAKKALNWFTTKGLQLPEVVQTKLNAFSDNTVTQKEQSVKNNISENTENYSESSQNAEEKAYIPATRTGKLLDKYDKGEITREEFNKAINRSAKSEVKRAIAASEAKWEKEHVKREADRARWEKQQAKWRDERTKWREEREAFNPVELHKKKIERIREEAVRNERKEQEIRKNRESSMYFIRRSVKRLDRALRSNSKAKHVPENLKGAVTEFCRIFAENDKATFDSKDLSEITTYYRKFGKEKVDGMKYDPYIMECLDALTDILPGRTLNELNVLELETVRTVADALNFAVKEEEQVFLDGKRAKLEEAGNNALKEIAAAKTTRLSNLGKDTKARGYFVEGNLKPIYFFKRLGKTYSRAFGSFLKGQDKFARNMEHGKSFVEETKNKYSYDTWKKDTVTLETQDGQKYTISVGQALQLVATAEREKANELQASEHLSLGGVVFDTERLNAIYKVRENLKKAQKSGNDEDIKSAKKRLNAEIEKLKSKPIQLTFAEIEALSKKLSKDQKGYMRAFVEFLSTNCAAWGNEVTMEQYGYRQYNETNYFPYVSAEQYLYTDPAAGSDTALRHASFTNSLQRHANNPLVVSSFTDVALSHIEQMASYNAMTVPVETLNKLFNYKTAAVEPGNGNAGIPSHSMKAEIENKFGKATVKYIENFIRDVNNGVRGNSRDSFINSFNSKFKKTAVLGNLSVIVQQPMAINRACADMDFKYMLKASKYKSKNNYEEMKEFAPVATIKQMGSFDTGVGVKNSTWLSGEQTFMEKLDDFLGKGAEKADEIAWSYLWSAVKAEIAGTTNLTPGSTEFLEAAGERVSDIINKTQVYDSVLSKSENMRNKGLAGALTSFMAEPTTEINMLYDAYSGFARGEVSGKQVARVTTVLVNTALLTAIAQGFAYAMRDKDDDDSFLEKWAYQSSAAFVDNLNPLSKIPYIRDIFSIWDGYDVERQDFSLVSDVVTAVKSLTTGEPSYYKVRKLAEAVANLYGIPLKNVLRDIEATVRTFLQMFDDNTPTAEGIKESILEGVSENDIIAIFTGKKSS